jgi:DNA-binding CsgD family transcriptional regulator
MNLKENVPDTVDFRQLLLAATSRALLELDPIQRRRLLLSLLVEVVGADAGHWSWGHGVPEDNSMTPVVIIDFGYTPEQFTMILEFAMRAESVAMFQSRIAALFDERKRAVATRRCVIADDEWRSSPLWSGYVARLGFDSWVHAVRYGQLDGINQDNTWCCLHFVRQTGKSEFGPREAGLVELALNGIEWLDPRVEVAAIPDRLAILTPRQRAVASLLLGGLSRKKIAARLSVSEETVNTHVKAVFKHFHVQSTAELSAYFLRRQ